MKRTGAVKLTTTLAATIAALVGLRADVARAYDPATTHAGLTERAALASTLHRVLARRLNRPLGLFEPIVLRLDDLPVAEARSFERRLDALDPATGYRPGPDGAASALAWVVAGSVVAATPAERGQHLFYDPARGSGLANAGGLRQFGQGFRQLVDAGSGGLRALATGTAFNMTGRPSTEWLVSPDNDVGLTAFYRELETAVTDEDPRRRSSALARALLALGGTLTVLEDAGEPAHVRNDFRGAYLGDSGGGPFDRGSAFERFVADSYGRGGIPAAAKPVARPTVLAYITGADGQGLADRTQRRFFSDGSLPVDAIVDRDTTGAEVMQDARASLPYAYPRLPHLELRPMGKRQYAYTNAAEVLPGGPASDATAATTNDAAGKPTSDATAKPARRRLLAYERVPGRVRFFLDRAVYADSARTLLPEIGAYGAGLIDLLFRAEIRLAVQAGTVAVSVTGARGDVRDGRVRLYGEDASGRRRAIAEVAAGPSPVSVTVPGWARRVAAVLRAQDDAGELVAVAEAPAR
jgi:hypothetical protein